MPVTAINWNVVIRASWNTAILTPRGIGQRLFNLAQGTPVEVRVPLDGVSPYQVHHDGVVVIASPDQLLVQPDVSDAAGLAKAMQVGVRAVQSLDQTPFTAAGFNIRYRFSPVPPALDQLVRSRLDEVLVEAGRTVGTRTRTAACSHGAGTLNVEVTVEGTTGHLVLNFHRGCSEAAALQEWLATPIATVVDAVNSIRMVLGVGQQEGE